MDEIKLKSIIPLNIQQNYREKISSKGVVGCQRTKF